MRSAIKNVCIKTVSVFVLLFGFIFSLSAFGMVGDMIICDAGYDQKSYDANHEYLKKNPNNVMMIYGLGIDALCIGKTDEGMRYIEDASNGGHIMASHIMALYYKTDGTLDSSTKLTKNPYNFNQMLFYYERAAKLIELSSDYPEGVTEDMPYLEEHNWVSAKVFVSLPGSYFNGYSRALGDILRDEADVTDTEKVLEKMRDAAYRCLQRPALSVWNDSKKTIAKSLQVRCQAMWDFADGAISLEEERIRVAGSCSVALRDCPEHKQIIGQLKQLVRVMRDEKKSVPFL